LGSFLAVVFAVIAVAAVATPIAPLLLWQLPSPTLKVQLKYL
jgi:hypothetical protein